MMKNLFFLVCCFAHVIFSSQVPNEDIEKIRKALLDEGLLELAENRPKGDTDQLKRNLLLVDQLQRTKDREATKDGKMFRELNTEDIGISNSFFEFRYVDKYFMEKYFHSANAVCFKKGTPFETLLDYNEQFHLKDRRERRTWFTQDCIGVEFGLVSFFENPIDLFFQHPDSGDLIFQNDVKPGERNTIWRYSYIGHRFVVKPQEDHIDQDNPKHLKEEFSFDMEFDTFISIGDQESQIGLRENLSENEFSAIDKMELNRADRILKKFTPHGYKRITKDLFPKRLWGSIRTFWHNNRNNGFYEIWNGRSNYVNWWQTTPKMVVVPFGLKAKWHQMFQPLLEEWANVELEPTDLYGIRIYYNESWLVNHVDRHETHAVSAIINVEQMGMVEDWELEIYSFDNGIIHSDLQQGEAMYYESAKVMHGRPKAMNGDYYANVFFHYKPKVDGQWWLDTSDPVGIKEEL